MLYEVITIAIKNIHFDGARWTPVRLAYASRVTITGNRITGVRPHPAPDRPVITSYSIHYTKLYEPDLLVIRPTITRKSVVALGCCTDLFTTVQPK